MSHFVQDVVTYQMIDRIEIIKEILKEYIGLANLPKLPSNRKKKIQNGEYFWGAFYWKLGQEMVQKTNT